MKVKTSKTHELEKRVGRKEGYKQRMKETAVKEDENAEPAVNTEQNPATSDNGEVQVVDHVFQSNNSKALYHEL